jgi:GcrA cell cycle regulator
MNAIVLPRYLRPCEVWFLWTDEAIDRLRALVSDGMSAGEIGREMGTSRNAIIGKARRLGVRLMGKPADGAIMRANSRAAPQIAREGLRPTVPAARVGQGVRIRSERVERHVERAAEPVQLSAWITICDLNERVCHFPAGDPRDLDTFRYCGASIGEGERYCGGHRRVMYRPAPKNMEL